LKALGVNLCSSASGFPTEEVRFGLILPGKGGGLEAADDDVPEDDDDLRVVLPPTNNDDTNPSTKVFFFKKTLPSQPPLRIVFISLVVFKKRFKMRKKWTAENACERSLY